jgi:hypothetical protein
VPVNTPNPATERSRVRNELRLASADASDETILGELVPVYLSDSVEDYIPSPVVGPDDSFVPPPSFLANLKSVSESEVPVPGKPSVSFSSSPRSVQANADLLAKHDFDLGKLLEAEKGTTLGFGSEFRSIDQLRKVMGGHPNFPPLEEIISNGMSYRYSRTITDEEREKERTELLARGNHKSAQDEPEQIARLLQKEVLHGFALPIPVSVVEKIKGSSIQPLGLAKQWGLQSDGSRKVKYRMTQDLTYCLTMTLAGLPVSINSRIDMDLYSEMIFGWCLLRIITLIVSLRFHYPKLRILIAKYDYSDAYRRMTHDADAAAQTIAICLGLAYIALRLTFGGSPNPPTWTLFSEMVTDLANEITQCDDWDPLSLHSPAQPVAPEPIRLPDSVPLAPAAPLGVIPPPAPRGRIDGFIDDLINVFPDTPENCARLPHVVPLAIHATSRPHAGDDAEPVPRRPLLSNEKLIAEGAPDEVQIVLGWVLDCRRLLAALPADKFDAWTADILKVIDRRNCPREELEAIVGRLNHVSFVIPLARHFLSRLWALVHSKTHGKARVRFSREALSDLKLWLGFLESARKGISMNLIVTRQPSRLCFSDSCPFGIGGWNIRGRAWRIRIPTSCALYGNNQVNNLLEFLGMAINILLEVKYEPTIAADGGFPCILALGDSTSAVGWLHRTSGLDHSDPTHHAHLMVAREIASVLMTHQCCLASQHIKGDENLIADLLSFTSQHRSGGKTHPIAYDDPSDDELTRRFHLCFPSQIPQKFKISPLPNEILSWVSQVLQTAASSSTPNRKEATKTETESGEDGCTSAPPPAEEITPSSLLFPTNSGPSTSSPFSPATASPNGPNRGSFLDCVRAQWSQALCAKPQATWLRRFGSINTQAPCTSRDLPTCIPASVASSPPTPTSTPLQSDRKRSRPSSSEPCTTCLEPGRLASGTPPSPSSPN